MKINSVGLKNIFGELHSIARAIQEEKRVWMWTGSVDGWVITKELYWTYDRSRYAVRDLEPDFIPEV